MQRNIKNSSGKIIGTTTIENNIITIQNKQKPILEITEPKILEETLNGNLSNETIIKLFNEYTLTTGEIASLANKCYSNINKKLKAMPEITIDHRGRRNRAFGQPVSKTQSQKMSQALKGRKAPVYERTPEMRAKISQSLKKYYAEHPQNPEPHILNWKNGKYDNVDFKIGIGGQLYSLKTNQTIRFRSLLELYYMLQLEQNPYVITYKYEPFKIKMENNHTYMPDFLINNKDVIELKSKKYVQRVAGVQEKVLYKKNEAEKYCKQYNYTYKIVYDEDIGFESKKMKYYLRDNPDIIKKYQIKFNDENRIVIK